MSTMETGHKFPPFGAQDQSKLTRGIEFPTVASTLEGSVCRGGGRGEGWDIHLCLDWVEIGQVHTRGKMNRMLTTCVLIACKSITLQDIKITAYSVVNTVTCDKAT